MEAIKDQVLKIIKKMPEDVTVDEIMSELHFKLQVDRGLQELDDRKAVAHPIVKKRLFKRFTRGYPLK